MNTALKTDETERKNSQALAFTARAADAGSSFQSLEAARGVDAFSSFRSLEAAAAGGGGGGNDAALFSERLSDVGTPVKALASFTSLKATTDGGTETDAENQGGLHGAATGTKLVQGVFVAENGHAENVLAKPGDPIRNTESIATGQGTAVPRSDDCRKCFDIDNGKMFCPGPPPLPRVPPHRQPDSL